jgi:plastocyanin
VRAPAAHTHAHADAHAHLAAGARTHALTLRITACAQSLSLLAETTYYPPISAAPGDAVVFSFAKGAHAVVALPDEASWAACARPFFRMLASTQDSPFRFVVPGPGTYYFACPVDDHCEEGMRVKVVASGTP